MARTRVRILDGNQIDIFGINNTRVSVLKVNSSDELIIGTGTDTNTPTTRVKLNLTTGLLTIAGISDTNQFLTVDSSGLLSISYKTTAVAENITLQNKEAGAGYGTSIQFQLGDGSSNLDAGELQLVQAEAWGTAATRNANVIVKNAKAGTNYERLRIDYEGKVGLTNTTPAERLDLNYGNLRFNGISRPSAPSSAPVTISTGNLNGSFTYKISYINGSGETFASTKTAQVTAIGQTVRVTGIPLASAEMGVTARGIYRGGTNGPWSRVGVLENNTGNFFDDNDAGYYKDEPPTNNSAGFLIREGKPCAYLGESGSFVAGTTGILPRNSRAGYLHVPGMSGSVSGSPIPNFIPYSVPLCYDVINNTLQAFNYTNQTWYTVAFA